MKTLTEQLRSARRELSMRRTTYPRWVRDRRMTQEQCLHEIDCMESIVVTLSKAVMLEETTAEMLARPHGPKVP